MELLPQDIVVDILSRLPIQSLVQSNAVCRAWHSLIQDLTLVNNHFHRMVDSDPSLIFKSNQQLYFAECCQNDVSYNLITRKLPMPPLPNIYLLGSCNGLLCLRETKYPGIGLHICNPFTRAFMELPKLHIPSHPYPVGVLGFGVDPNTQKYKAVVILYSRKARVRGAFLTTGDPDNFPQVPFCTAGEPRNPKEGLVYVLTVGTCTWRNLGNISFLLMWQESQVQVNGKLHWISKPEMNLTNLIVSFDLETEHFLKVPTSNSMAGGVFNQVAVLRGCLSTTFYHFRIQQLEVWIMKQYGVKESWTNDYSIGEYIPRIFERDKTLSDFYPGNYYFNYSNVKGKYARVLCLLASGEIVLSYESEALVLYNPNSRTFKDLQLKFEGSTDFDVVVHVGSLNWIEQ